MQNFRKFREVPLMSRPSSRSSSDPQNNALLVVAMLAMVAVPAGIALHTVRIPAPTQTPPADATPYGYTVSLLLFIIPIIVIGWWFVPQEGIKIPKRAFSRTISVLFIAGCALDYFFANRFFTYRNPAATLRIPAPALGGPVPIEEYVFYLTGFIAVLLIYVWLDEYWLLAYNVPDYPAEAKKLRRLLQFHPTSLVLGLALIGLAIAYKKFVSHSPGFPGYFTLLVAGGIVPAGHQLAGLEPDAVHYSAREPVLGGDPGRSLRLVGLPAATNDGLVYWGVGRAANRGRVCLDRGHLRDSDCFRSHQTLAGLREAFERRVFRRARSPVEKDASGR